MKPISYKRHRFPPDTIRLAVRLYFRFTTSLREVCIDVMSGMSGLGLLDAVSGHNRTTLTDGSFPNHNPKACRSGLLSN